MAATFNPYEPPRDTVEQFTEPEVQDIVREGRVLIVGPPFELPNRCVHCNRVIATSNDGRRVRLTHRHPVLALIGFGPIVAICGLLVVDGGTKVDFTNHSRITILALVLFSSYLLTLVFRGYFRKVEVAICHKHEITRNIDIHTDSLNGYNLATCCIITTVLDPKVAFTIISASVVVILLLYSIQRLLGFRTLVVSKEANDQFRVAGLSNEYLNAIAPASEDTSLQRKRYDLP
jgi:hypothetical protein